MYPKWVDVFTARFISDIVWQGVVLIIICCHVCGLARAWRELGRVSFSWPHPCLSSPHRERAYREIPPWLSSDSLAFLVGSACQQTTSLMRRRVWEMNRVGWERLLNVTTSVYIRRRRCFGIEQCFPPFKCIYHHKLHEYLISIVIPIPHHIILAACNIL